MTAPENFPNLEQIFNICYGVGEKLQEAPVHNY